MASSEFHFKVLTTFTILIVLLLIQVTQAEIRHRSSHASNSISATKTNDPSQKKQNKSTAEEANTPVASTTTNSQTTHTNTNTDFIDKMSWKCVNNASCIYSLTTGLLQSYRRGDTVKLGFMDLIKLPPSHLANTKWNTTNLPETGRSMSSFVDFISGNAIRIPVGPMVFSVQRDEEDGNYIEVALLKKATSSTARLGGGDDDSGGGGGHVHGIVHRFKERHDKEDKKQMQMYIPMYLAATTFGWTMVAAKFVGVLTLKALAISKVAFIIAAMVLMKKLMENASEKMMYQYPEHNPYIMPYSMDYGIHSMAGPPDMGGSDIYAGGLPLHAAALGQMGGHQGHPGMEHLAAESSMHQNIAEVQNNTQVLAALNAAGLGQKVKREDSWLGRTTATNRRPMAYNYLNPYSHYRH